MEKQRKGNDIASSPFFLLFGNIPDESDANTGLRLNEQRFNRKFVLCQILFKIIPRPPRLYQSALQ